MNIAWWLERAADEYGERVALIDVRSETEWTHDVLRRNAEAVSEVESIPRTQPKRTKDLGALKRLMAGITLSEKDGVVGRSEKEKVR